MGDDETQQVVYKFDEISSSEDSYANSEKPKKTKLCYCLLFFVVFAAIAAITAGVVLLRSANSEKDNNSDRLDHGQRTIRDLNEYCEQSEEAQRVGLNTFLRKCQNLYFEIFPHEKLEFRKTQNESQEILNKLSRSFKPFVPTPLNLKKVTDKIIVLQNELNSIEVDEEKLKPKENQILAEIKALLSQLMSTDFESGFYEGGWMFGPNYFCFSRICRLQNEIHTLTYVFRPSSADDVETLMQIFLQYNATFNQHIENLQFGIKSGMVKSASSCQAGERAFKELYLDIINYRRLPSVSNNLRATDLYSELSEEVHDEWKRKYRQSIPQSLYSALIHGFVKPARRYFKYLSTEYGRHCPPDQVASGLATLPVQFEYTDGMPDFKKPTTKKLPLTGIALDGKELYSKVLKRYVTLNVSADTIYDEGIKQMKKYYSKIVEISKTYTEIDDEDEAIAKMRKRLHADDQWHGSPNFPEIESNATAYMNCVDEISARKFCPVRWRSMEKWKNYLNRILGMIHPLLNDIFYFTGDKVTVPNCPITIQPHFNPSIAAMFYEPSNAECTTPTVFSLPFFLEKYGPKYQEWSTTGHEARPGHNFQVQGSVELFSSPCQDSIQSFFHHKGYFSGFVEGWALYSENPVLSDDVLLYEDNMLQKLGMYKMQVWRAMRLVIDSGLHSRDGKNKDWALKLLEKYGLDDTDFSRKEVVRYMSAPGQAASYMIGRLEFMNARTRMEEELGADFNIKDFHYQVLSLGSVPLEYLSKYIERYLKCLKEPTRTFCEYLLTPVRSIPKGSHGNKIRPQNHLALKRRARYFL